MRTEMSEWRRGTLVVRVTFGDAEEIELGRVQKPGPRFEVVWGGEERWEPLKKLLCRCMLVSEVRYFKRTCVGNSASLLKQFGTRAVWPTWTTGNCVHINSNVKQSSLPEHAQTHTYTDIQTYIQTYKRLYIFIRKLSLSVRQAVRLYVRTSVCLSSYMSIRLSVCLSICLSVRRVECCVLYGS